MLKPCESQRGITLVELMIASVIALIALSAVLTIYSATAYHSSQQLQQAYLHQQLQGLMHLISSDLKRAGYRAFSPDLLAPSDNPFQNPANQVHTGSYDGESPDSCILFAYDLDQDGLLGVGDCDNPGCAELSDGDNVEQFGFRLRDTGIQSRFGGTGFDCASGYWQTINDPGIEITQLHFRQVSQCLNLLESDSDCASGSPQLVQGGVEIRIGGRLGNQPDTGITLTHWVRLRNDLLREGDSDAD
ncbi:MAG: prepilin-type N-terminal cleavage/methylation domain-containing protein [Thiogranum sp.]